MCVSVCVGCNNVCVSVCVGCYNVCVRDATITVCVCVRAYVRANIIYSSVLAADVCLCVRGVSRFHRTHHP